MTAATERAVETADADEIPSALRWALRTIGLLVAFGAVVVLLIVLRVDDLVRSWAMGNDAARRILETQGLDALMHPDGENQVEAPHFIAPAVTLFGTLAALLGVLSVFLRNGFEWARVVISALVFFLAVAGVGAIQTGPPVLFSLLALGAIAIAVVLVVLMWLPSVSRYLHPGPPPGA